MNNDLDPPLLITADPETPPVVDEQPRRPRIAVLLNPTALLSTTVVLAGAVAIAGFAGDPKLPIGLGD
jgi:hypothetical protein